MAKNVVKSRSVRSRADLRREVSAACLNSLEQVDRRCIAPCWPDLEEDSPAARSVRDVVWKLRSAFTAMAPEVIAALTNLSAKLAARREPIRKAAIAWVDLIDELTTSAQETYGSKDHGKDKRDVVKAAIVYYARSADVHIEGVPDFLEPFLYDSVADFAVEAVYRISRQQPGWYDHSGQWARPRLLRVRASRLIVWIGRKLSRLAWWLVLRQKPLAPQVKQAVDRVVARSKDADLIGASLRGAVATLTWIVNHRRELIELLDTVIKAMHEAEARFEAGEDKRDYARDLIIEFLIQESIIAPSGLGRAFIEATIDIVIDAVVEIFNKRAIFTHRKAPAPPPPLPVPAETPERLELTSRAPD